MRLNLVVIFLFTLICECIPHLLQSQVRTPAKSAVELAIFVGGQDNKLTGLNSKLSQFHMPTASTMIWNGGAGLRYKFLGLIVGADFCMLYKNANELGDILGTYMQAFISTKILGINRILVYPEIGIGRLAINVNSLGQSSMPDFDDYLIIGRKDLSFNNINGMIDLALCIRFQAENKAGNTPIFRMGLRNGLNKNKWEIKSADSKNGPTDRMNNFYFQMMFGISR